MQVPCSFDENAENVLPKMRLMFCCFWLLHKSAPLVTQTALFTNVSWREALWSETPKILFEFRKILDLTKFHSNVQVFLLTCKMAFLQVYRVFYFNLLGSFACILRKLKFFNSYSIYFHNCFAGETIRLQLWKHSWKLFAQNKKLTQRLKSINKSF